MKESGKERLKSTIYESTLSTADAVPLPRWGRLRGVTLRVDFYKGRCPKVVFKSRVTSHNNDMSSPLEKGRAKGAGWICPAGASFYVADNVLLAGIVSHVWHEILRLSPHLFWLGFFSHRAFSSAQDDDTRGRKGSHLGDTLRVLELAVLYYDTSSPLEKGRAKGAGWIHEAV